jgi:hypothetical protein
VTHPAWEVWRSTNARTTGDLSAMYGDPLGNILSRPPVSAFLADGSAVAVHNGRRISETRVDH